MGEPKKSRFKAIVLAIDQAAKIALISAGLNYMFAGNYALGALGMILGVGLLIWNQMTSQ